MSIHSNIMKLYGLDEEVYALLDQEEKKDLIKKYLFEKKRLKFYYFLNFYLFIYFFFVKVLYFFSFLKNILF